MDGMSFMNSSVDAIEALRLSEGCDSVFVSESGGSSLASKSVAVSSSNISLSWGFTEGALCSKCEDLNSIKALLSSSILLLIVPTFSAKSLVSRLHLLLQGFNG